MASLSPPTFPPPSTRSEPNTHKPTFTNSRFFILHPPPIKRPLSSSSYLHTHTLSLPRASDSFTCRCNSQSDSPSPYHSQWRWDSVLQDVVRNVIKQIDSYINAHKDRSKDVQSGGVVKSKCDGNENEDWDWDRWRKHFKDVEEQERIVSILKLQLGHAVIGEDYADAARLKVAIAAAVENDTVGEVMSHLNRAIKNEHYRDAAFIRDHAGTGLVGWWAGISEDSNDPYGRIIRITAEHGRYVARSYTPRQLATATAGVPLFEIFLLVNKKGEYKQQAVYLKRSRVSQDSQTFLSRPLADTSSLKSNEDKSDVFSISADDIDNGEDRDDDANIELSGFQNILRDMIPGVKMRVLKVSAPEKVDRDLIFKVIEQIMEEDDEENDTELESVETEDEEAKDGSDHEQDDIEMDAADGLINSEGRNEIAVKVVVGGVVQKLFSSAPRVDLVRVPARLEKRGRLSFSFCIEKDDHQKDLDGKGQASLDKEANIRGERSIDHVMFDLAKFIGSKRIPLKVLKDIGDLINLTLSQAHDHQPLSGSTTFNRIEFPASPDPLNGLYIGAHGLYTSEVIHLRRKFGQWKEDGATKEPSKLEFYEYVEALKITGDPYVPAGQVTFRAKIGKRNQLPHKGIIPEEFGVIARYKGQGRLAEPGFQNPRWVDGELVILDGKYIKGGPVVGFVYWAPEYHFLVFFNRLRLE